MNTSRISNTYYYTKEKSLNRILLTGFVLFISSNDTLMFLLLLFLQF